MRKNRLFESMQRLRAADGRGLAPYVTAGDGGLERTRRVLLALAESGATCVELGVPFSDPIADGPVLQAAAQRALAAGTSLGGVLEMIGGLRAEGFALPVVLFSYANPLVRAGWEASLEALARAGIDGLLVPDLPVEEGGAMGLAAREQGVCPVFFAAPTTSDARLELAASASSGFLYLIGRAGVTGAERGVGESSLDLIARARRLTDLPLAVGFGISESAQVAEVTAHADLAIVGSALVERIHRAGLEGGDGAAVDAASEFMGRLMQGLRR